MNHKLLDVQAGFIPSEEPEIKLPTSAGSSKKQDSSGKTPAAAAAKSLQSCPTLCYFCFIEYAKAFDCVDHNKLWEILQDHLTSLLRNLYAGQEATVRAGYEKADWFQIRKGVRRGCILLPCLFNLHAEYIMRNARLGIKIAGRNINNLRYADDTTLMAESEELKILLMKLKENEKVGLKLNIQKTKIMPLGLITS